MRDALLAARERTLALADAYAAALGPADMRVRMRATLNPPLWELGHVAWFQEYWIGRNRARALGVAAGSTPHREGSLLPCADSLYDSSAVAHDSRWELPLPDGAGTRAFLARTQAQTLELLDALPPFPGDDALYFFRLATLHEEMHAEAAVYMAHALGIAVPATVLRAARRPAADTTIEVPAQTFRIGWSGPGFAFDNELLHHDAALPAWHVDAQPVSWSRFIEFARDGGYRDRRCWDESGWAWLQQAGARQAAVEAAAEATPAGAAVHLSAHEAHAWCRWAGRRLPTEAEWECAALTAPAFAWGEVWEWTASVFAPYPGFRPHPYRDYSQPWFGSRVALRGACRATAPSLAHPRYRNFFEPHRTDVFAGFRSCAVE